MKNCLFIFTFLSSLFVSGQNCEVRGRFIDRSKKGVSDILVRSPQMPKTIIYSDDKGFFSFPFDCQDSLVLIYSSPDTTAIPRIVVRAQEGRSIYRLNDIAIDFQQVEGVIVRQKQNNPFELDPLKVADLQKLPLGGVERFLLFTTAATSNNELTSNYNVRGGNYDENLVYVNGFLIYRPFLTRSGQQEGMSFINTALVENVSFSAGGFDARYGDKLSSVLDIDYRTPLKFKASAAASLLGVESHVENVVGPRFNYLVGARYRANGYLLNSLPAKGAYNPVFVDGQFVTNYDINENLRWSVIGHYSSNDYRFAPQTQRTDFGTVNEAYSFVIYYDGQEQTKFLTGMAGTSLKWQPTKKTQLDLYATAFRSVEREYYDILGQYFINELETDPGNEEFGDSVNTLGIGSFLNHARNKLNAQVYNLYHDGKHILSDGMRDDDSSRFFFHQLRWGVNGQMDIFNDQLSEWRYLDSAGYSLPQTNPGQVELNETIKGNLSLQNYRATSYFQSNWLWSKIKNNIALEIVKKEKDSLGNKIKVSYFDTISQSSSRLALNIGTRAGYTDVNKEFYVTPRASLTYYPRVYMVKDGRVTRRDVRLRLASGLYYQPPFYREFRTFEGDLNTSVLAQKSFHLVGGADVYVNLWGRSSPFKISSEVYYKEMWDVNPYEVDNVRTRYFANNDARAYAYGFDVNMNGQFVEGIESYFKLGLLSTKEDLLSDFYYEYYNVDGEKIVPGFTNDNVPVDSIRFEPGYIPRPTDQMLTFGALIQDQMPGYESFSVQMGMQYGTPLPYGPPTESRYQDTLRMKAYFRVDIGFSYDFLYKKKQGESFKNNFWTKNFEDAILSFEVFNLLGIDNVLSKQWIQDVSGRYYSIPNNLTQRRFNLKLILRI
jgi:hypothetical protein